MNIQYIVCTILIGCYLDHLVDSDSQESMKWTQYIDLDRVIMVGWHRLQEGWWFCDDDWWFHICDPNLMLPAGDLRSALSSKFYDFIYNTVP